MNRPPKVLITGINGFTGYHMGRYLLSQGIKVVGTGRTSASRIKHKLLDYEACDLLQPNSIGKLLRHRPDYIIHLAVENNTAQSWHQPLKILQTNMLVTVNLLEEARLHARDQLKGILVVGSSHEYGNGYLYSTFKLTEQFPAYPATPYGWSKMLQTCIAEMYAQLYSIPITIARTFNLIGPKTKGGVCADFARQVAEIELGYRPPLLCHGNESIERDFLDVRDAVNAYWLLLQRKKHSPGEIYHVCRGSTHQISNLVSIFKSMAKTKFESFSDPALFREQDPPTIRGSNQKLRAATGWKPLYPLEASIHAMLTEARESRRKR